MKKQKQRREALIYHSKPRPGKIEVAPTKPYRSQRDLSFYENLPMNLILGGAIGNLIDRTLMCIPSSGYGGVVDFIDIGFGYYRWFTFNIADVAITFGIILYLLLPLLKDKNSI